MATALAYVTPYGCNDVTRGIDLAPIQIECHRFVRSPLLRQLSQSATHDPHSCSRWLLCRVGAHRPEYRLAFLGPKDPRRCLHVDREPRAPAAIARARCPTV